MIANVCPAMSTVPPRGSVPVPFGLTASVTVPLPVPEAPAAIAIQLAWLVAVHAHGAWADTATECLPPAASIV